MGQVSFELPGAGDTDELGSLVFRPGALRFGHREASAPSPAVHARLQPGSQPPAILAKLDGAPAFQGDGEFAILNGQLQIPGNNRLARQTPSIGRDSQGVGRSL
jgi:hypothetical protein